MTAFLLPLPSIHTRLGDACWLHGWPPIVCSGNGCHLEATACTEFNVTTCCMCLPSPVQLHVQSLLRRPACFELLGLHRLASSAPRQYQFCARLRLNILERQRQTRLLLVQVRYVGVSNETAYGVMQFTRAAEEHNLPRIVSIQV